MISRIIIMILSAALVFSTSGIASTETDLDTAYRYYVSGNYEAAVKHLTILAEQGHADAQYNLGVMYDNGRGVPQDYVKAAKWYRLAAEQGHADAQHNLGVMYVHGQGVPQDHVQAYMWFNLAATGGDSLSTKNRDQCRSEMTPEQVAEGQRLAREWLKAHQK